MWTAKALKAIRIPLYCPQMTEESHRLIDLAAWEFDKIFCDMDQHSCWNFNGSQHLFPAEWTYSLCLWLLMHHIALYWTLAICLFNSVHTVQTVFISFSYLFNPSGRSIRLMPVYQNLSGRSHKSLGGSSLVSFPFRTRFRNKLLCRFVFFPLLLNHLRIWGIWAFTMLCGWKVFMPIHYNF